MTADVLPRTLETRAQFFPDDGPRTLETREEAPAPRPARGAAIVLLAASECPEYDGTRCVMDVLYRPGWEREAQRLARDADIRVVAALDGRLPTGSGRDQLVVILGAN